MPKYAQLLIAFLLFSKALLGQSLQQKKSIALDMELEEMSGLIIIDSTGYTINDSGGKACLYGFDLQTGQIRSRHFLKHIKNRDFEALTQSKNHVFIGDIGNNYANRPNFQIYILSKKDLPQTTHPKFNVLSFTLPQYSAGWQKKHDFDLEAMIVNSKADSLYLFSKNRASNLVSVYGLQLENSNAQQTARFLGKFRLDGMVTAANVYGNDLFLLNYNMWNTTLYKIPNFASTPIEKWLPISIKVKGKGYQREALWIQNGLVYIGTERTRAQTQAVDIFEFK